MYNKRQDTANMQHKKTTTENRLQSTTKIEFCQVVIISETRLNWNICFEGSSRAGTLTRGPNWAQKIKLASIRFSYEIMSNNPPQLSSPLQNLTRVFSSVGRNRFWRSMPFIRRIYRNWASLQSKWSMFE